MIIMSKLVEFLLEFQDAKLRFKFVARGLSSVKPSLDKF